MTFPWARFVLDDCTDFNTASRGVTPYCRYLLSAHDTTRYAPIFLTDLYWTDGNGHQHTLTRTELIAAHVMLINSSKAYSGLLVLFHRYPECFKHEEGQEWLQKTQYATPQILQLEAQVGALVRYLSNIEALGIKPGPWAISTDDVERPIRPLPFQASKPSDYPLRIALHVVKTQSSILPDWTSAVLDRVPIRFRKLVEQSLPVPPTKWAHLVQSGKVKPPCLQVTAPTAPPTSAQPTTAADRLSKDNKDRIRASRWGKNGSVWSRLWSCTSGKRQISEEAKERTPLIS